MDNFSETRNAHHPIFSVNLKKQHHLKTYFEHIDDSLFVLSLRAPKLSAEIDTHIAEAHFNLDQSLENFAEMRFNNGISNQQYVMTAANELADMLSTSLDNMKNPSSNSGSGSGKGKGKKGESFSLPDIIQGQKDIIQKMKEGLGKPSEQGKPKDGENGKPNGSQGKGKGQKGKGEGDDGLEGEIYQIYKEQAQLRQQLENALKKGGGNNGNAKKALQQMENLEREILNNGINQNTLNRMQKLNYQLLKLDEATLKQGKEEKRKSSSNDTEYNKNRAKEIEFKKLYYNQTEILNRQSLPLQENYKKKVQEYFNIKKETEPNQN